MKKTKFLFVGGLVAMGFDNTGKYLLTVSHSGRGVFDTNTWERVARDSELAYPDQDIAIGIGPIEGQNLTVISRDENRNEMDLRSPNNDCFLHGESDGITVTFGEES